MARDEKREAARSYTLAEVLAGGFEARCLAPDGTRYLLCQGSALRVDPHTREAILVSDLGGLPGGPWRATSVKVVYERLRSIRFPDAQLAMS